MPLNLSTRDLAFHLRQPEGRWDLHALPGSQSSIEEGRMSANWRRGRRRCSWDGAIPAEARAENASLPIQRGILESRRLTWDDASDEVEIEVEFAAGDPLPALLWRVTIRNRGSDPIHLDQVAHLSVGRRLPTQRQGSFGIFGRRARTQPPGALRVHRSPGDLAFFINGYQSWSFSGTLDAGDRYLRSRLGPFTNPLRLNGNRPQPKQRGWMISEMFGVLCDRQWRTGILAGFLTQRQAFGTLEVRLDGLDPFLELTSNTDGIQLDAGEAFSSDWAYLGFIQLDDPDPLAAYLEAVGHANQARTQRVAPAGWCSWYHFFDRVTVGDVERNLDWAREHHAQVPLGLIQLDDGFQANVGDWFETNNRFPDGLGALSQKIKAAGFLPGLWLAPFIAKPDAALLRQQRDWVLRNTAGMPVNAGFIWNRFTRALDVTHPGVLEHVRRLVHKVVDEWGYGYLKFDFLYAGALQGNYHNQKLTRAQALFQALSAVREAAGEAAYLLGCGCPLGSGIGVFDSMRIGADVAPSWAPHYLGTQIFFDKEPDFPSVRNALVNIFTRQALHQHWWSNDPDCLLVRASDSRLTLDEVRSLATAIALSGGSLLVSDDLPTVDDERLDLLARLLPPIPGRARVVDLFDHFPPRWMLREMNGPAGSWWLLSVTNWEKREWSGSIDLSSLGLPAGTAFHVFDFWQGSCSQIGDHKLPIRRLAPHGVGLFALRRAAPGAAWLGDNLHISAGLALKRWEVRAGAVSATLDLGRRAQGEAFLQIPGEVVEVTLDGRALSWSMQSDQVLRISLAFDGQAQLEVRWG